MRYFLSFLLLLAAAPAAAGEVRSLAAGEVSPPATIEDIAWLAGHWAGEGLGGISYETFSPPIAGQMTGHFQMVRDDRIAFYEIIQIVPHQGSLMLRLKHFNADLTGWEERDEREEFPLVAVEEGAAYFDGLTFRRVGEDGLEARVLIGQQDGSVKEGVFTFRRAGF